MKDKANIKEERVELTFDLSKGNFIKDIFYEFQTEKAVKFTRKSDNRYLWVPKSAIKGSWNNKKDLQQKIFIKFNIDLFWQKIEKNEVKT